MKVTLYTDGAARGNPDARRGAELRNQCGTVLTERKNEGIYRKTDFLTR